MSIESYRHRRPENWEYKLSNEWYLDPVEVDQVCEMISRDEITKEKTDAVISELAEKMTKMSLRSGGKLSPKDAHKYDQINEAVNKLRKLNKDRVAGAVNLTKEDDTVH